MRGDRTPDFVEGTVVHLDLRGAGGLVSCTVLAFLGPSILVGHAGVLAAESAERLAHGAGGYVLLEREGRMKALRCGVRAAGERVLLLDVMDGFRLGQRREWTRVAMTLDASLRPLGIDAPAIATTTLDVCPGGVQVRRPERTGVWPRYELTLSGGTLAAPVIGQVSPTRALPESLSLRFTHLAPAATDRLVELVVRDLASQPRARMAG